MPYISAQDDRREKLRAGEPALSAGELNYQMFYDIKHNSFKSNLEGFVEQFLGTKRNYQKYNDLTGAIVRCALEVERRLQGKEEQITWLLSILESYNNEIAIYEDKKILENTDVE